LVHVSQILLKQLRNGGLPAVKLTFFLLFLVLQAVPLQHQRDFALTLLQNARKQTDGLFEYFLIVGFVH